MSAILLADGSPHARRMGEKILEDEGYAVVCVADGAAALKLLADIDPDLLIAEASLAGCSGIELCRRMKTHRRHTRVILTAGILEALDQDEGRRAGCDAMIRKPFEATAFLELVRQQVNEAQKARVPAEDPERAARERIEAEVARQVEAALPKLVREITEKVLLAMRGR
jgi:DNA-binding response OmpR family regulator